MTDRLRENQELTTAEAQRIVDNLFARPEFEALRREGINLQVKSPLIEFSGNRQICISVRAIKGNALFFDGGGQFPEQIGIAFREAKIFAAVNGPSMEIPIPRSDIASFLQQPERSSEGEIGPDPETQAAVQNILDPEGRK